MTFRTPVTLILITLITLPAIVQAQNSQFSFQGFLEDEGVPADGVYDFKISIWDALNGGTEVFSEEFENRGVTDGIFNLAPGPSPVIFGGNASVWLEVGVRDGASIDPYATIGSRTQIQAAPMALALPGVTVSGGATPSNLITIGTSYVDVSGSDSFGLFEVYNAHPDGAAVDVVSGADGVIVNSGRDGVSVSVALRYGIKALGSDAGAYLRNYSESAGVRPPDLILGGTSSATAESDDGVIQSDPDLAGSDIVLRVNDAAAIFLDENGSNDGDFEVYGGGSLRFNVDDDGAVSVPGTLSKGGGSFEIDHPLDPTNRILRHSFVESPDMMNVYNGNVILDANGEASIDMPSYFEALNSDFRYQLTCVGGYAPVYVAEKIRDGRFLIAGGRPGLEVSWQVTGIRQDAWANENRIVVEEDKEDEDRGRFMHPEAFGEAASAGMMAVERDVPSPPLSADVLELKREEALHRREARRQQPEVGL